MSFEVENMEIPPSPSIDTLSLSIYPRIVKTTEFSDFDLFEFFREKYRSYDSSFLGEYDAITEINFLGDDFAERVLPPEERGPLLVIFSFLSPVEIIRSHIYVCRGFYTTGHYILNRRVVPITGHHQKLLFGEFSCVNGDLFYRLIQKPFDVTRKIGSRGRRSYTLLNFAIRHDFYKAFLYLIEERNMILDEKDFDMGIMKGRCRCLLRMIQVIEVSNSMMKNVVNVFIENKFTEGLKYVFKEKMRILNEGTRLVITSKSIIGLFKGYDEVTKNLVRLLQKHLRDSFDTVMKNNGDAIIITGFSFKKFKYMVNINPKMKYSKESSMNIYALLTSLPPGKVKNEIFDYIYEDKCSLSPNSYRMAFHYATRGYRKRVMTLLPLLRKDRVSTINTLGYDLYQYLDYSHVKDEIILDMLFNNPHFRVDRYGVTKALENNFEHAWKVVKVYINRIQEHYYQKDYQKMDFCLLEAVRLKRDKIVDQILNLDRLRIGINAMKTALRLNSPHCDRIFEIVLKNRMLWKLKNWQLTEIFFSCLKGKYFKKADQMREFVPSRNSEINRCVKLGCVDYAIGFLKVGNFKNARKSRAVFVNCMHNAVMMKCKDMVDKMMKLKEWNRYYWFYFQNATPKIMEKLLLYRPELRDYIVLCRDCKAKIPVLLKKCREDYFMCERNDCWKDFVGKEYLHQNVLCSKCACQKVEHRTWTTTEFLKYYCKNCMRKYKDEIVKAGYDSHNFKQMNLLSPYY